MKLSGLSLLFIIIGFSIIVTIYIDKQFDQLNVLLVAFISGGIMAVLEFIYKIIQNTIILNLGLNLEYFAIVKLSLLMGLFVASTSLVVIKKRRGHSVLALIFTYIVLMAIVGNTMRN